MSLRGARFAAAVAAVACAVGARAGAAPVAVRYAEGLVRGYLRLTSLDGMVLADGDLFQTARNGRVTSRLVYRFRDGSFQEETTQFTEEGTFRLVSDRLVQRGPSFPRTLEARVERAGERVSVRYGDGGKEKEIVERMDLPADLSNGMVSALLKNLAPETGAAQLSMIVFTPKPRLVRLDVARAGRQRFSSGRTAFAVTRFEIHVEVGGLAGLVAPLLGKAPKDASVWISGGDAPGFVRSESQFYPDGPVWRIELSAPQP